MHDNDFTNRPATGHSDVSTDAPTLPLNPAPLSSHPISFNFSRPGSSTSAIAGVPAPAHQHQRNNEGDVGGTSSETRHSNAVPAPCDPPASPSKTRSSVQGSRFFEGSMRDRASAIPPLSFIGPGQEDFERRLRLDFPGTNSDSGNGTASDGKDSSAVPGQKPPYLRASTALGGVSIHQQQQQQQQTDAQGPNRPFSATGNYATGKKGFWGGLKEKLSFYREKGTNSNGTGSKRPVSLDAHNARSGGVPAIVPANGAAAGATGAQGAGGDGGMSAALSAMGVADGKMPTREEIMANYQELMRNGFFSSHAIQSTRQPPPGSAAARASAGPFTARDAATSSETDSTRNQQQQQQQQHWPLPTISSPSAESARGTKRTHSQEDEDASSTTGSAATYREGSSFKKLRKSASRISSEITIPRLRRQRSQQPDPSQQPRPSTASSAADQTSHAAAMAAMPPPPAPLGIHTRRSFSSSSRRETNRLAKRKNQKPISKSAISAPRPMTSATNSDAASHGRNSLDPARMSIDSMGSSFISNPFGNDSRAGSMASRGGFPGVRDGRIKAYNLGCESNIHNNDNRSAFSSRPSSQGENIHGSGGGTIDRMDVDAENRDASAESPALRVRPDANRGIPVVPRIPEQFKARPVAGVGDAIGVGAENHDPMLVAGGTEQQQQQQGKGRGRGIWGH